MKYVVSFTTSPKRIHKCQPMINSLLNQSRKPDLIVLNIPHIFARTGQTYDVPKNVSQSLYINLIEKDYGPGTKIIPTISLLIEKKYNIDDTRIIYLDDDIIYPINMIKTYENTIKDSDNSVWTATGFNFVNLEISGERRHGMITSIAEGYGGVCVKMSTFRSDFIDYINEYSTDKDCFLSDDMILSNYYHKHNISIYILNIKNEYSIIDMWQSNSILEYGNQDDALHKGADGTSETNVSRYKKVIKKLGKKRYFKMYFIHQGTLKIY
tara:strand:- start:1086 stop:1889 length:804 start_codon:yes stop_codon:yes gene_type:complete